MAARAPRRRRPRRLPRLPRLANRWRITLWIVVSTLTVTLLLGVVAVSQVRTRFTARIDHELRSESVAFGAVLDVFDEEQITRILDEAPHGIGRNAYGLVVTRGDRVTVDVPPGTVEDPDPRLDTSRRALGELRARAGEPFDLDSADGSTAYRAFVTQLDGGGLLVLFRPLSERDDAVRTVVQVFTLTGIGAAVLIVIIVAVVTSLVTRPLDAMIGTAEAIGDGDLTSRVDDTGGVDDVNRLAAALNHMQDRLQQAFDDRQASEDALRRFVADASHELRTPLATVLGYAELHEGGMAGPDDVERSFARIRAEGERMRLLVEELLTLARLDEGRPLERAPVDLAELATQAVTDLRATEPARTVDLRVAEGTAVVPGDAMSLRQALDNLLVNACAHTPASAAVTVSVRPAPDGDAVLVEVADDGPGLAPEVAAHVFERFYRADDSRSRAAGAARARRSGSGLGLAIVAAVAEAHGGRASLASEPGAGATFTLRLPR